LLAVGGSPGNAFLGVLTVLLAVTELVLAVLFLRGSRRAASWLAGYQALCLWGTGWALAIHLGADNHFAPLVTNLVIPTLLLVVLLRSRRPAAPSSPVGRVDDRGSLATGADEVRHTVDESLHGGAQTAPRAPIQVQL
nr:hypothetical protein [Candidatus Dormibacteraeota bacterium]